MWGEAVSQAGLKHSQWQITSGDVVDTCFYIVDGRFYNVDYVRNVVNASWKVANAGFWSEDGGLISQMHIFT